jgi:hypothetical protein
MPTDRPFAARVNIPEEALQRVKLEEYIPEASLKKLPQFLDSVKSR